MQETLVFGDSFVTAEVPDDTHVVSPGFSLPLPPATDLAESVRDAVHRPLDLPPLRELARGASRVTVAFDDPTVPCYAPVWSTAVPIVLSELAEAGVPEEGLTLVCANACTGSSRRTSWGPSSGPRWLRASLPRGAWNATTPRTPTAWPISGRRAPGTTSK